MNPFVVLGGGLAGLSCATHLLRAGSACVVLERDAHPGGKASSERAGGFVFDRTGHWLHLRDPEVRSWICEVLGDAVIEVPRKARILSHGVFTRYPFQANTFGLPPDVIRDCLVGFVKAYEESRQGTQPAPRDLGEAFQQWFGEGICRHFMIPYNEKLWGVPLSEITAAWCSRFVPRPSLDDVVGGAVGVHANGLGYNPRFLYPAKGGIGAIADALATGIGPSLRLDAQVVEVRWRRGEVRLASGDVIGARRIVSTLPLPSLIRRMSPPPPDDVLSAAGRLRA
ncbi:MAG TPA: amine oxidase, partial [Deltaproteobacteria bacterium]|nr:amine oxidase [Deltaproteobacteria bacterium]